MSNEKMMVSGVFKNHFAKYCLMVSEDLSARLKTDTASSKIRDALENTEVSLNKYLENDHINKEDKISKEHFYVICSLFELYSGYLSLAEDISYNLLIEDGGGKTGNIYAILEHSHREYLYKFKEKYLYNIADIY